MPEENISGLVLELLRRLIKFILAIFYYYSGLLYLIKRIRAKKNDFTILMYHRVLGENDIERDHIQAGLIVSPQAFEKQMAFLSRKFRLLSLENLVEILKKNQAPPSKSIIITFDDGWRDNYIYAYPILKKYNIPATIFLATDFIDSNDMFWFAELGYVLAKRKVPPGKLRRILEETRKKSGSIPESQPSNSEKSQSDSDGIDDFIEELKQFDQEMIVEIIGKLRKESGLSSESDVHDRQTLSWSEVLEMRENGIDFGSHGCSHRILTGLNREEVKRELIESKEVLEKRTRRAITLFSYPNGDFNDEIKELVREAGYNCAISTSGSKTNGDPPDLLALKRIGIHDGATAGPAGNCSKAIFACLLE